MDIKEGKCGDEHWVLQATNKPLNTASKTYNVLCWPTEHNKNKQIRRIT